MLAAWADELDLVYAFVLRLLRLLRLRLNRPDEGDYLVAEVLEVLTVDVVWGLGLEAGLVVGLGDEQDVESRAHHGSVHGGNVPARS